MSRVFTKNTSNYMSLGVNALGPLLNGASAVSIHALVSFTAIDGTADNSDRLLQITIDGATTGIFLGTSATSTFRVGARSVSGDSLQALNGTSTIALGTTYSVGAVLDYANDAIYLFVNGVLESTLVASFTNTSYTNGTPTAADAIGGVAPPSATSVQVSGTVGHIAVWAGHIAAAGYEQLNDRAEARIVRPDLLTAYFPLGGDNSPEIDIVNGLTGTITGTVAGDLDFRVFRRRRRAIVRKVSAVGPATAVNLSGPSAGTVSVASSNFTVTANGTITGTVTFTPTSNAGAGTFTPTTVNISAGSPSATFTYTPSNAGARVISGTNNGSLSGPAGVVFSVPSTISGNTSPVAASARTLTLTSNAHTPIWVSDDPESISVSGGVCTLQQVQGGVAVIIDGAGDSETVEFLPRTLTYTVGNYIVSSGVLSHDVLLSSSSDGYTGYGDIFPAITPVTPGVALELLSISGTSPEWRARYTVIDTGPYEVLVNGTEFTLITQLASSEDTQMVWPIRQGTNSQEVPLGPFFDADNNPATALGTIPNTAIRLFKTGAGGMVDKNSGGAPHVEAGIYLATFDATDANTPGPMAIYVSVVGARPYRAVLDVLPAHIYDARYGTSLRVFNLKALGETAQAITAGSVGFTAQNGTAISPGDFVRIVSATTGAGPSSP